MSQYQSNGLWNDKPNRKSNNHFIYGAYAAALQLDTSRYREYFMQCVVRLDRDNITITRHPGQPEPPISHDEVMGMCYLGLIPYDALKGNHFVYNGHGQRLDSRVFERLAKSMLEMAMAMNINLFMSKSKKVKQRNLWWRRNLVNVKYFATRLNPAQTYAVKKYAGRKYHTEEEKLYAFYRDCIIKRRDRDHSDLSERNLLWLTMIMAGDEAKAAKLRPWISFERYFGPLHPFTIAIRKKYGIV